MLCQSDRIQVSIGLPLCKIMPHVTEAKVVMSYLSEQDFEIMDWPPQSPDLNPIENLWKTLGVKVMERNPTNM